MNADLTHLAAVERWTLVLGALLLGLALVLCGPRWQLGASLGVLLMVGNAIFLRRQGQRLHRLLTGERPSVSGVLWLFSPKLGVLAALIYVGLRYLPADPVALLVGISVLPAAIVCRALQCAGALGDDPAHDHDPGDGPLPPAASLHRGAARPAINPSPVGES